MKELSIKKGTSGLINDGFKNHCQTVLNGLSGNSNFTNPTVPLAEVQERVNLFGDLVLQSQGSGRSPALTLEKNLLQKEIDNDMETLFGFVKSKGYTNIIIQTSSGFPLAKLPDPVHSIGQCQDFKVTIGPASGECTLKVKKLRGAQSYLFQYCETLSPETDNWVNAPSGDTTYKMSGLTPGVRYTFRVCAIRGNEMGPWSDYIIKYMS